MTSSSLTPPTLSQGFLREAPLPTPARRAHPRQAHLHPGYLWIHAHLHLRPARDGRGAVPDRGARMHDGAEICLVRCEAVWGVSREGSDERAYYRWVYSSIKLLLKLNLNLIRQPVSQLSPHRLSPQQQLHLRPRRTHCRR